MKQFYKDYHGDWLTVKFGSKLEKEPKEKYEINILLSTEMVYSQRRPYQYLVVLSGDGMEITKNGIKDVKDFGNEALTVWKMKRLYLQACKRIRDKILMRRRF